MIEFIDEEGIVESKRLNAYRMTLHAMMVQSSRE